MMEGRTVLACEVKRLPDLSPTHRQPGSLCGGRAKGKDMVQLQRYALAALLLLILTACSGGGAPSAQSRPKLIAPVSVDAVRVEALESRRVFSGSLMSPRRFELAAQTSGRVAEITADLGTVVENGQVVLRLYNEEQQKNFELARAELAVAEAQLQEAEKKLPLLTRELKRQQQLRTEGVATEAQLDQAANAVINGESALAVARARVERAGAAQAVQQLDLAETEVRAAFRQGARRVVAERFVQEGDLIRENQVLFRLVELDPIVAVVQVAERDYGKLRVGSQVWLTCDAFPDQQFEGSVARIAPVFDERTRQARVELTINNPDELLKPGMFVRAQVVIARVSQTKTVPIEALVTRFDETGVFLVNEAGNQVSWRPVRTGLRSDKRVEVFGEGLQGRVVTLGQQLIGDGSAIVIPESKGATAAEAGSP